MEHRYALIVGIDHYNDSKHFIHLRFAQTDARALQHNQVHGPRRARAIPIMKLKFNCENSVLFDHRPATW